MFLKYPIIVLLFLILAILQVSFLVHFSIIGITPNLVFILFFILIFFSCLQGNEYHQGIFYAIIAGIILDVLSSFSFGYSAVSLLLIYLLIKIVIYFLKEIHNEYILFYFIPIFLISFIFYNILMYIFFNFPYLRFNFTKGILIELVYNLIFVLFVFFIYKYINNKSQKDRQLKLFN